MKPYAIIAVLVFLTQCRAQDWGYFSHPILVSPTTVIVSANTREHGKYPVSDTLLRSTDCGVTWHLIRTPTPFAYMVFPDSVTGYALSYLPPFSITDYELYKTTDGGVTWRFVSRIGPKPKLFQIDFNLVFSSSLVGLCYFRWKDEYGTGFYKQLAVRTENGGTSWDTLAITFDTFDNLLSWVLFTDSLVGYAMPANYLQKTTDAGKTWTFYGYLPGNQYYSSLTSDNGAILAYASYNVYKVHDEYLFVSHDTGKTWYGHYYFYTDSYQKINRIEFFNSLYGFAFSRSLDVSKNDSNIYMPIRTTDGGYTWNVVPNPPVKGGCVWSAFGRDGLGFVTGDLGGLAKTTDYGETWNSLNIVTAFDPAPSAARVSMTLGQNYPNPVSSRERFSSVPYHLPSSSHVRLVLYDIMGRIVRTVLDADRSPGDYSERLDVAGLPPGVYLIALMAGGQTPMVRRMEIN